MAHVHPWTPSDMSFDDARKSVIRELRKLYPVGTDIAMSVVNWSRSGLSKTVKVFAVCNGEVVNMSNEVALALDYKFDNSHNGVVVGGSGDPVDNIRYALSLTLHRNSRAKLARERGADYTLRAYRV